MFSLIQNNWLPTKRKKKHQVRQTEMWNSLQRKIRYCTFSHVCEHSGEEKDKMFYIHIFLRAGGREMECVILSVELVYVSEEAQVKRGRRLKRGKWLRFKAFFFSPVWTGGGYTIPELWRAQASSLSPNFSRQIILILFFSLQSLRLWYCKHLHVCVCFTNSGVFVLYSSFC